METFPLSTDALPVDENGVEMDGWLLFLDEFNSADRGVQKAAYRLVLDRQVGKNDLHPNVAIIAAGNLDTDGAIVEEMSTALQSRICHLNIRPDHKAFMDHARRSGFHHKITSFLEFKPACLYTFDPEKADVQETYACYRTWEFADRQLKVLEAHSPDWEKKPLGKAIFAGSISLGVATEFLAFLRNFAQLPSMAQILADPKNAKIPKEPGTLYALTGAIGQHADKANIAKVMEYVNRIPMEFQVITLRELIRRNEAMLTEKPVNDWVTTNSKELY